MEKIIKFRIIFLLYLVLSVSNGYSQNVETTNWTLLFSKQSLEINDTVTLTFIGKIPKGQGVYSTHFKCDYGPNQTRFRFENPNLDYTLIDSAISIGDSSSFDEIFGCKLRKFKGTAIIKQVIKINKANPAIKGLMDYQTCTEDQCLKFTLFFETNGTSVTKMKNDR